MSEIPMGGLDLPENALQAPDADASGRASPVPEQVTGAWTSLGRFSTSSAARPPGWKAAPATPSVGSYQEATWQPLRCPFQSQKRSKTRHVYVEISRLPGSVFQRKSNVGVRSHNVCRFDHRG